VNSLFQFWTIEYTGNSFVSLVNARFAFLLSSRGVPSDFLLNSEGYAIFLALTFIKTLHYQTKHLIVIMRVNTAECFSKNIGRITFKTFILQKRCRKRYCTVTNNFINRRRHRFAGRLKWGPEISGVANRNSQKYSMPPRSFIAAASIG